MARQLSTGLAIGVEIVEFCSSVLDQLRARNSPVHSTWIIYVEEGGIAKWDPRRGPECITPNQIEEAAWALKGLAHKAVEYSMQVHVLQGEGKLGTCSMRPSTRLTASDRRDIATALRKLIRLKNREAQVNVDGLEQLVKKLS